MKRILSNLAVRVLDWVGALHGEQCRAYGGLGEDRRVRLCCKWRWHTDSHAYEWEDG